jgi:hypothetical protein
LIHSSIGFSFKALSSLRFLRTMFPNWLHFKAKLF